MNYFLILIFLCWKNGHGSNFFFCLKREIYVPQSMIFKKWIFGLLIKSEKKIDFQIKMILWCILMEYKNNIYRFDIKIVLGDLFMGNIHCISTVLFLALSLLCLWLKYKNWTQDLFSLLAIRMLFFLSPLPQWTVLSMHSTQ